MNYTIEYVELENRKKPFEGFVLSLTIHERAKELRSLYHKGKEKI